MRVSKLLDWKMMQPFENRRRRRYAEVFIPRDSQDWKLVPFQPLLFTTLWIAGVILAIWGDITAGHCAHSSDAYGLLPNVWTVLLLLSPPMGLLASWLIVIKSGVWRYRGFWLRLVADIGIAATLLAYMVVRISVGDYHVLPAATLIAATMFSCALVYRDIHTLLQSERLATKIRAHGAQENGVS